MNFKRFVIGALAATFAALSMSGFVPASALATTACATPPIATTKKPEALRNVAYSTAGTNNATALDIYTPDRKAKRPVIVFVHGGGWQIGDKKNDASKSGGLTGVGYVYITINYRLVPSVQYPDNAKDVGDAVAWVYNNVAAYGGDPNCLFLMGHSAGAHLAALISTDEQFLKANKLDLSIIKGTILLDGASYELTDKAASAERNSEDQVQAAFGDDPAVWKAASPISHIEAGKFIPPMLLIHVAKREASRDQALQMAELLKGINVSATVYSAAGKTHETLNKELGSAGDVPTGIVLKFINVQITP